MASPEPGHRMRRAVATLDPGYFAYVMATGIVSTAMRTHNQMLLSRVLLWLAGAGYAVLVVLTGLRLRYAPPAIRGDLANPQRSFRFFTFVAGTDVLGSRLLLGGAHTAALALLVVGGVSWLILGYVVPWVSVLGRAERPVVVAANGTWFVWVVASQSVAVLAAVLSPSSGSARDGLALIAVCCWSIGAFLYAAVGVLVAARILLYPVQPEDLTPPYWVAMGATAITVLAGGRITALASTPGGAAVHGLILAASMAFWAFGTWLIPALIAAGWWRHVLRRFPLRYEPALWSVVFPLGMYGVASYYLGIAAGVPIIRGIGATEMWVALAAWTLTFAAMCGHLVRTVALPTPAGPAVGR